MVPAGQSLEADKPSGAERDDRLVDHRELVAVDRLPQVCLQLQARDGTFAHARVEQLDRRSAVGLRAVKRNGRVLQQPLRTVVAGGADGDPDGCRHEDLPIVEIKRGAQGGPKALGYPDGVTRVGNVVEEHGELVPSKPR